MAHKKGGGSSRNNRDSRSKRLGVKLYDGALAQPGSIIIRQRGSRIYAGQNVAMGRDYTLYATAAGLVKFEFVSRDKKQVSVLPEVRG